MAGSSIPRILDIWKADSYTVQQCETKTFEHVPSIAGVCLSEAIYLHKI